MTDPQPVRRPRRRPAVMTAGGVAALALLAAPAAGATGTGGSVGSASCPVTVTIGGGDAGLTLTPDRSRVAVGGCVTFANSTSSAVRVQVADGSQPMTVASGRSGDYQARVRGTHDVSVEQTRPLFPASASGTVRVTRSAPSPSPSPSASSPGDRPSQGSGRTRQRSGHHGHTAGNRRRGGDRRRGNRRHSARASLPALHIPPGSTAAPYSLVRRGPGSLPKVAGPRQLLPSASPSASPAPSRTGSVVAGPPRLHPVTGGDASAADLALSIAGLLALGQLAALWRVLAVVDNRRRDVGPHP